MSGQIIGPIGVLPTASAPFAITYIATPAIQTSGTTSSFSVTLGAGSAGRIIVVCMASGGMTGAGTISGINLATVPMTQAIQEASGNPGQRLAAIFYIVDATSNASTAVDITGSTSINANGIAVYAITGAVSSIPTTSVKDDYNYNADPQLTSAALTINAGGGAIVFGHSETVGLTPVWNNATQDGSLVTGSSLLVASAHTTSTGTVTPSVNAASQGWGMVAASWA